MPKLLLPILALLVVTTDLARSHESMGLQELTDEVGKLKRKVNTISTSESLLATKVDKLTQENADLTTKLQQLLLTNDTGLVYLEDNSILAFRLTAGTGTSAYGKYTSVGYNDDHAMVQAGWNCGCRSVDGFLPCDRHYRSRFLDLWPSSLIDTVRVTVYYHAREMAYVEFNGRGSTYTNWFSANRVVASSWTDLRTQPHNYFSLAGDYRTKNIQVFRRFYINRSYNSCPGDQGWLTVVDDAGDICSWAQGSDHPIILYSTLSTVGTQNNPAHFAKADVLTVTVKLREDVDILEQNCSV